MRMIDADKFVLALMDASLSSTDEDTILDLVDACAENWEVYGGYISDVNGACLKDAKELLAKTVAQCVERMMLDNDMFLVDGGTVSWRLLICSLGERKDGADHGKEEI